jgi:hypothetical protein
MRRVFVFGLFTGVYMFASLQVLAQGDGGYRLVPNWAKLRPGMYFGMKEQPPFRTRAERDAEAAKPRPPQPVQQQAQAAPSGGPGISGIAVGPDDRVYVFNRGTPQVIVFNPDGSFSTSGGTLDLVKEKNLGTALHSFQVHFAGP